MPFLATVGAEWVYRPGWVQATNHYEFDTVWKGAVRTWVWSDLRQKWEVLWAAVPAQPTSTTATFVSSMSPAVTRVDGTITPPAAVDADTWRVYRTSDTGDVGASWALVASLSPADLVFAWSDPNPLPLTYHYYVRGVISGIESAGLGVQGPLLDLTLVPTGLTATYNSGTDLIDVAASHNVAGVPDIYRFWMDDLDNLAAGPPGTSFGPPYVTSHINATGDIATSLSTDYAGQLQYFHGRRNVVVVAADLSNYIGTNPFAPSAHGAAASATANVSIPAVQPATLALTKVGSGNIHAAWTFNGHGYIGGATVQKSTNGTTWTAVVGPNYAPTTRDIATTVPIWVRVAFDSPGGQSTFRQAGPITPLP
jgi:hypothetical protein